MTQGNYPRFKGAACHAASVFLNSAKTAEKACDLIAEAARHGAKLVVFPKSFLPGFPVWAGLQAPILSHDFFKALAAQAVRLEGPELSKIRMAARSHDSDRFDGDYRRDRGQRRLPLERERSDWVRRQHHQPSSQTRSHVL